MELEQTVYALDSTTIDLCLNFFPWARFRSTKAAIKLHTLLDLRGPIPSMIAITDGRWHDVNALDVLMVEPGAFYVMDRGYVDFARLHHSFKQAPTLSSVPKRVCDSTHVSQPIDPDTGLRSDQHWSTSKGSTRARTSQTNCARCVSTTLTRHSRFCFLTNNFCLPALTICRLYKMRWQVELFFKWIKQHLRIKRFYGNSRTRSRRRYGSRCASTCWWRY